MTLTCYGWWTSNHKVSHKIMDWPKNSMTKMKDNGYWKKKPNHSIIWNILKISGYHAFSGQSKSYKTKDNPFFQSILKWTSWNVILSNRKKGLSYMKLIQHATVCRPTCRKRVSFLTGRWRRIRRMRRQRRLRTYRLMTTATAVLCFNCLTVGLGRGV